MWFTRYNTGVRHLSLQKLLIQSLWLIIFFCVGLLQPPTAAAQCASGQIDLLEYMGPQNGASFDLRYCDANQSASGSEPIQVVRDTVITTQGPKQGFFLNKGSNYEAYFYDDSSIYFYEDTSWGESCPNGSEAFYRVFTPGGSPGGKMPRCVTVGQQFSSDQYIIAYKEAGYTHGDPGLVCNDQYQSTTIQTLVNLASTTPYAPTVPGTASDDTIVLQNLSGAGAGEYKYYTRGYGLTGFVASDSSGEVFFHSSFFKDGLSDSEPDLICSDNADAGFNLSQYPDYNVLQELFYIHPINGIHPESLQGRRVSATRADLAAQGYETYCAANSTSISLDYNTEDIINDFINQNPNGVELRLESRYSVDATGAQVSLFRDTNEKRYFGASIEEFFSFKDVYKEEETQREVSTAPINSLLSQDQRCATAISILKDAQLMCERLTDPSVCALLTREIPTTSFNVGRLLEEVLIYFPEYRDGGIRRGCNAFFDPAYAACLTGEYSSSQCYELLQPYTVKDENGEYIGNYAAKLPLGQVSMGEYEEMKQALANTPLNLERSYRLAFLVASIENKSIAEAFNFFSLLPEANPKHEVLVVAFKIPDILTNKGGGEASGHTFFTDAASLTRNILVPRAFNRSEDPLNPGFDKESRNRRTEVGQAAANANQQSEGSEVYCVNGTGDTDDELAALSGSPACKDVLGKAIVDLINGQSPSCENMQSEPVREILESAQIIPPAADDPTRMFNPDYGLGTDVLNYLFRGSTNETIHRASNEDNPFQSILNIVKPSWNNPKTSAEVNFYLVYPVGYELDSVTNVLKHTFLTKNQVALVENNDTVSRFQTQGFGTSFAGGSASHTFPQQDLSKCEETTVLVTEEVLPNGDVIPIDPPYEEIRRDCTEEFTITANEEGNGGLSILGAHLGYWMRTVQKSLNTYYGLAWAYIDSCKTTEEFLTGSCAGGPGNPAGSDNLSQATYCLNWNGLSSSEAESIKNATRSYLTSLSYFSGQHPDRYDAVAESQYLDWNGTIIPPEMVNFYENYYGGGRALLWTQSPQCNNQVCFEYIMNTCGDRGINPALCVGMSITESGGLNQIRFPGTYDFGCLAAQPNNVSSGLDCLMNDFFFSTTPRNGLLVQDMSYSQMWLEFAKTEGFASSSYTRMQDFLEEVQNFGSIGYSIGACQ